MSLLAVGLSHRSAPLSLIERVSLSSEAAGKLLDDVVAAPAIDEAMLLSTCNRVELYASVEKFHAGVAALSELLARHSGIPFDELSPYVYVHYEERAVQHLFSVTASLDSMLVGEHQILGQVRAAFRLAQERGDAGTALHDAVEHALHAAKRAHAETGIDAAGTTLVEFGLRLGGPSIDGLAGRRAVVVGAGSMAGLAVATVSRLGAAEAVVASRTDARARRLAEQYDGRAVPLTAVQEELADTDLLISCTGATGVVLPLAVVAAARDGARRPLAVIDLALPHDVDPSVADLPGVSLFGLARLAEEVNEGEGATDIAAVREIVTQEITAFLAARRSATVTPTVVALRTMATGIVEAEMQRLTSRLPGLDADVRAEVEQAVRRVADKLLHQPTVRVKELANEDGAVSYAAALAELFSLDPDAVEAVTRAEGMR